MDLYEKKYKEKYEQALRVAKETYDTQPMYREWLEKMFPELKESEDERIRKGLIGMLSKYKYVYSKEIAWLKKQGEQKPNPCDGCINRKGCINCENGELRETEQKPSDKFEQKGMNLVEEDMTPFQKKVFCIIDTTIEEEQGLKQVCDELLRLAHDEIMQKPAWSEEEECYIRQLESMVKEKWALAEKAQDEEVIKNMSNLAFFLKTLNPNKKPADEEMKTLLRTEYEKGRADAIAEMQKEWSEEDEENFCSVYLDVKSARQNTVNSLSGELEEQEQKRMDEVISWLKSLRPQNTWKPSDEQMNNK